MLKRAGDYPARIANTGATEPTLQRCGFAPMFTRRQIREPAGLEEPLHAGIIVIPADGRYGVFTPSAISPEGGNIFRLGRDFHPVRRLARRLPVNLPRWLPICGRRPGHTNRIERESWSPMERIESMPKQSWRSRARHESTKGTPGP